MLDLAWGRVSLNLGIWRGVVAPSTSNMRTGFSLHGRTWLTTRPAVGGEWGRALAAGIGPAPLPRARQAFLWSLGGAAPSCFSTLYS